MSHPSAIPPPYLVLGIVFLSFSMGVLQQRRSDLPAFSFLSTAVMSRLLPFFFFLPSLGVMYTFFPAVSVRRHDFLLASRPAGPFCFGPAMQIFQVLPPRELPPPLFLHASPSLPIFSRECRGRFLLRLHSGLRVSALSLPFFLP